VPVTYVPLTFNTQMMYHTVQLSQYRDSCTGCTVRGSNLRSGDVFSAPTYRLRVSAGSFPEGTVAGRSVVLTTQPVPVPRLRMVGSSTSAAPLCLPRHVIRVERPLPTVQLVCLFNVCEFEVSGLLRWCVFGSDVSYISKKCTVFILKDHCAT